MYNKYRVSPKSQRTVYGITFASKKEMCRYLELRDRLIRGEIRDLTMQVTFILQPAFVYANKKEQPIKFTIDFVYYDKKIGCVIHEETKGMRTRDYILRRKMFLYQNPDKVFIET
jgi:hypothetical protein